MKSKNCKLCNKEFNKLPSDSTKYWQEKAFCSKRCANTFNDNSKKLVGIPRPLAVKEKMSKTMFKKGQTPWNKGKPHLKVRGENHHRWKGGITPKMEILRHSLEYKLWRTAVFERDNYTCRWCGDDEGRNLNADHIQEFAKYPELRFAIDNGRTLCKKCHISRHSKLGK